MMAIPRMYSAARKRWEWAEQYGHDGEAWVEIMRADAAEDDAAVLTSMFDHDADTYIGRGTVLQRDVSGMALHPESEQMAQWMWEQTPFSAGGAWGAKTALNTSAFGTQPVHAYVVDSTHPACTFQEWDGHAIGTPAVEQDLYMRGPVPMLPWMVPAQNGDRGIAIYDLGTGIMREGFMAIKQDDGKWKTGGGYSLASPGLRNLAEENYGLQQRRGIATVSGMHNALGFIGIAEALNRRIEHALCVTVGAADTRRGVSWPSRAADGKAEIYAPGGRRYDPDHPHHLHDGVPPTPTHGQWGRLPDDVDPMHDPRTGRAYLPFTRVLIEAAKKYGLVLTDTNLWVNAFNGEQGRTFEHVYGEDPWRHGGLIQRQYRRPGDPSGRDDAGLDCRDFPWDRTEWAVIDWGRPSPDWNLRPGELSPWWHPGDPRNPLAAYQASS